MKPSPSWFHARTSGKTRATTNILQQRIDEGVEVRQWPPACGNNPSPCTMLEMLAGAEEQSAGAASSRNGALGRRHYGNLTALTDNRGTAPDTLAPVEH
jgi:hypothetical protein